MSVSRIWKSLVLHTTQRGHNCSQLFERYQIEMFVSQLSDRTHTPIIDFPLERLFRYHRSLAELTSHPLSTPSSKNTSPTSDTRFHILVISADGLHKECFFGTRSQLASQVDLFLMTGKNTPSSPRRSFTVCLNEVWCLHFSGQLQNGI